MTVYIVDLEAVESRYTCEWKWHLPQLFKHAVPIEGAEDIPKATTPGAFLNFGGTNIYKAKQIETISRMFCEGTVKEGDHFLFADAWHPGIISLKYMSELLQVPVKIHSMWHAGSYDPHDFLGRLIHDKQWTFDFERSIFHASDYNYFATKFHIKMFVKTLFFGFSIFTFSQIVDILPKNFSTYNTLWKAKCYSSHIHIKRICSTVIITIDSMLICYLGRVVKQPQRLVTYYGLPCFIQTKQFLSRLTNTQVHRKLCNVSVMDMNFVLIMLEQV